MKKLINILLISTMALTISACESDQERELRLDREHEIRLAKINNGQDAIEQEQRHERSLAYIQRPVSPGNYIDYRGNSSYGYWDSGSWAWNNPQSQYAMQSRQYVDYQMATGVLATAVLTQSMWNSSNSGGWKKTNVTVNNYTSTSGKTISKSAYTAKNKAIAKSAKAKAKSKKKTVVVTKKPAGKWDSKRTTKPTYAKGGFSNKFAANSKKAAAVKTNKKSYTKTKTKKSYSKPKTKPKKKSSYSKKSSSKKR